MNQAKAIALKTADLRSKLNRDNIPKELKDLQCWVVWKIGKFNSESGKFDKLPIYPKSLKNRSGTQGSAEDKANLGTFEEACAAFDKHPYLAGIGIALLEDFGIAALDVDRCVVDGKLHSDVAKLTDLTYCEFSPSGRGIRAFWLGSSSNSKNHTDGYELFHSKGFVTVTGDQISNSYYFFADDLPELEPAMQAKLERLAKSVGDSNYKKTSAAGETKPESENDLYHIHTLQSVNDQTIEDLESALMALKQDRVEDYHQWINVLQALASLKLTAHAEIVCELAHKFSQRSSYKYDTDDLNNRWEGMNPTEITYKSVFKWAQDDGWINPRSGAALLAGQTHISRIDRTDAGNTSLLAEITDGNLRYVPERNLWLWWDGQRWVVDQYGTAAQEQALAGAEYYHKEAAELRNQIQDKSLDTTESKLIDKAAENQEKWATQCRNKRAIDSMLSLAKSDERFTLSVAELDRDPWLFGVENGVVNLRTGTLREAGRDDYVTRRSPVRFDPDAKAPRWQQFINEITASPDPKNPQSYKARPELADYLRRALGYAMTGSTSEHKMFIAIGEGSNGKNVLLDTLQWVLGDYCQTIPPEALMAAKYATDAERPSPTTAMLAGARVAIGSESKDGQKLDVALVKRHTGGGYITARYMRENTFRFEITHKLWLMTNHKPALDHMDEALRGRLHLIPFDMRWNRPGHPDRNPFLPDGDKDLMDKLKEEAEGILAWMLKGATVYHKEGLDPPQEVVRMTQTYFKESDPIARWLDECCEPCEPKVGEFAKNLFESFRSWCNEEGCGEVPPHSQTAFSAELKKRAIQKHKTNDGMRYGLRILEDCFEVVPVTGDEL